MSSDELERLLQSVPTRALSPDADAEILTAIRTAAGRTSRWYARPIPLWQATAACLLVGIATWLLAATARTSPPLPRHSSGGAELSTAFVRLDQPLFAEPPSSSDHMDISRWQLRRP